MNFDLTDEQQLWKETVHDFVTREVKPKAHQIDEEAHLNWEAIKKMGPIGLLGLNVAEEFGGSGIDAISSAIAIEELGWGCGSTALTIAAHNGLGCAPISLFGTTEQKRRFLPPVTSGRGKLAALALTESDGGSDLQGSVNTHADLVESGWIINGSKMWCTNASIADYIVTLVRTSPNRGSRSLSLFIVPTDAQGLHIAPAEKKMGVKGSPTHAITYENVLIPGQNLLGAQGNGLTQSLTVLDGGRVGIGALAIGLARAAFETALSYAKERRAFNEPIANKQAIQWMLADAATEIQAARWMVYYAAWLKENGKPFTQPAAMAKLLATEMAEKVCRNAVQILGGYGYSREFPVERIYRDARLMTIGEGTSEIQRLVIARNILGE